VVVADRDKCEDRRERNVRKRQAMKKETAIQRVAAAWWVYGLELSQGYQPVLAGMISLRIIPAKQADKPCSMLSSKTINTTIAAATHS